MVFCNPKSTLIDMTSALFYTVVIAKGKMVKMNPFFYRAFALSRISNLISPKTNDRIKPV